MLLPEPWLCSAPLWLAISSDSAELMPLVLRGDAPATPAHMRVPTHAFPSPNNASYCRLTNSINE